MHAIPVSDVEYIYYFLRYNVGADIGLFIMDYRQDFRNTIGN